MVKLGMSLIPWGMPQTIEGPGSITKLPARIKADGYHKVMVVTGSRQLAQGRLNPMFSAMEEEGIAYVICSGIQQNPSDRDVDKGVTLYRETGCQALVAFGGGSPMDCCKAIGAVTVCGEKTASQLQGLFRVHRKIPAIYAVPTTAGTGSETTIAAVITDSKTHHKASITDPCLMPKVAVLDPTLTVSLPPDITAITGMDALCHAVECYTNHTYNSKLENQLAEDAVGLIYHNLYDAYRDGSNLKARQNMQKAAFYAGRAFTRGSVGYVHAIGHTLGGLYDIPHGLAMAVLLPHVMTRFGPAAHERLARLAEVCGMTGKNDGEKAEAFLRWIENLNAQMNIPSGFSQIRGGDIPQMIGWAMKEANPLYPVPAIWSYEDFHACIRALMA